MIETEDKNGAYVTLYNFKEDPSRITEILGIQPSGTVRRGDIKRKDPKGIDPPQLHSVNGWTLSSNLPHYKDLKNTSTIF